MLVVRYSGKDPAPEYMAALSTKCDRKLCKSDCYLNHVVMNQEKIKYSETFHCEHPNTVLASRASGCLFGHQNH